MAGEARDEGPAKGGAARPVVAAASGRKAERDCPAATRQPVPAEREREHKDEETEAAALASGSEIQKDRDSVKPNLRCATWGVGDWINCV